MEMFEGFDQKRPCVAECGCVWLSDGMRVDCGEVVLLLRV